MHSSINAASSPPLEAAAVVGAAAVAAALVVAAGRNGGLEPCPNLPTEPALAAREPAAGCGCPAPEVAVAGLELDASRDETPVNGLEPGEAGRVVRLIQFKMHSYTHI